MSFGLLVDSSHLKGCRKKCCVMIKLSSFNITFVVVELEDPDFL